MIKMLIYEIKGALCLHTVQSVFMRVYSKRPVQGYVWVWSVHSHSCYTENICVPYQNVTLHKHCHHHHHFDVIAFSDIVTHQKNPLISNSIIQLKYFLHYYSSRSLWWAVLLWLLVASFTYISVLTVQVPLVHIVADLCCSDYMILYKFSPTFTSNLISVLCSEY
jgi:hypothetical protein